MIFIFTFFYMLILFVPTVCAPSNVNADFVFLSEMRGPQCIEQHIQHDACQETWHANLMKMKNYQVCGFNLPPAAHLSNQTINSDALFVLFSQHLLDKFIKSCRLTAQLTFPMNRETQT